jgi:hypothetical protein
MKFAGVLFVLCLATMSAAIADAPQPLTISVHGDAARATQLPQYDPQAPIAVTVTDLDAHEQFAIAATGPTGQAIRIPLEQGADGALHATLDLDDEGTWQLRLVARAGDLRADTTPVTLDVEAPPPSDAPLIGLAVGSSIFIVIGIGGFLLLRRTTRSTASAHQLTTAV